MAPLGRVRVQHQLHSTTICLPFQALYGREPPHLTKYSGRQTSVSSVEEQLIERDVILDELKFNFMKAQQVMKGYADSKMRDISFYVATYYLKLQPCKRGLYLLIVRVKK